MNFIVIVNDTLRPDHLSVYGDTWCQTPNAMKFAQTAAVFEKCYVGSFATIPARTDLFTGRFGEPIHPWLPLSFNEVTLPEISFFCGSIALIRTNQQKRPSTMKSCTILVMLAMCICRTLRIRAC